MVMIRQSGDAVRKPGTATATVTVLDSRNTRFLLLKVETPHCNTHREGCCNEGAHYRFRRLAANYINHCHTLRFVAPIIYAAPTSKSWIRACVTCIVLVKFKEAFPKLTLKPLLLVYLWLYMKTRS